MKTLCEIVVNDIMPNLRAAIARELIASYSLNQSEVAKMLDVSQPAVSQYLRQLRGKTQFIEHASVSEEIKEIAGLLNSKQMDAHALGARMHSVSKKIVDAGLVKGLDEVHMPSGCSMCN